MDKLEKLNKRLSKLEEENKRLNEISEKKEKIEKLKKELQENPEYKEPKELEKLFGNVSEGINLLLGSINKGIGKLQEYNRKNQTSKFK